MNYWIGVGNVIRAPEAYVNSAGKDVCKFNIRTNRKRSYTGEGETDTIPIYAEGKTASLCREYLRIGKKVGIYGEIHTYMYTSEDGDRHSGFHVKLEEITFLPSGNVDKPELGDIHSDDGCLHHDINFRIDESRFLK